jgi:MoxR-like ATPase
MLRGRRYVLPEDMTDLVPDVLRHRVVLSTRRWPKA